MPSDRKTRAAPTQVKRGGQPRNPQIINTPVDYDHALKTLARHDEAGMLDLAANLQTPPEMLFLLSQASGRDIRSLVAENSSTPAAADEVLVTDPDSEIRLALVRKISRVLPEIGTADTNKLGQCAAQTLSRLARDCDVIVRRTMAAQICRLEGMPKETVLTLARDVDALVAAPIFEFSPLLDEADLIGLANGDINPLCLAAIARRDHVGEAVSDCLVELGDITAVATLLRNKTAHIRETTLDRLVELAHKMDSWHQPLVERPELNERLALKLANFLSNALINQLAKRNDMSAAVTRQLKERIRTSVVNNVSEPQTGAKADAKAGAKAGAKAKAPTDTAASVSELEKAIDQRHEAVIMSRLAAQADVGIMVVRRIFATRIPKAIVALAWKANLTARLADRLQEFPGRILRARRLLAAEDGDFPMAEEEIKWHLSALGIAEPSRGAAHNS